jgi:CDP-6-deoxy-D-xylo-4-hexulose-3-dehydrase
MDFLTELCQRRGIKLIGDSCDSLGSKWMVKMSSYYVAWTSFYPAHHISTGEGGMVCTDIPELKKLFMSFLGGVEIVTVLDLRIFFPVELVETDLIIG